MRLPRQQMMNKRSDFALVRQNGRSKAGRFVVLSLLPQAEIPHHKVAFITTRKVGKAHDRNLMRRRLRAIVQASLPHWTAQPHFVVTIVRHSATQASFAELQLEWLHLARKLHLIATKPAPSPA